ncbi:hypothetical protein ACFLEY_22760 [Bradyrhizobium sp. YCK136]|uniref:hypothetical protein n=1 Tax=Bradyrhizobium sp. YCK136 TaxID=3351346 RepID=UPI0037C66A01
MCYIIKDDAPPAAPFVRASEFIWLSIAKAIGLAASAPEILEDVSGRQLFGSRREQSTIGRDQASCLQHLLSGQIHDGGMHLTRIYAFDLFCANWDRHPGNYLILNESNALVVFAIDFSHVALHPGKTTPGLDPLILLNSATRVWFKSVVQPYGHDLAAALDVIDRLRKLPISKIEAILTAIPSDWLPVADRDEIVIWWRDGGRTARTDQIARGLKDGTYI